MSTPTSPTTPTVTTVLTVDGMSCGHCERTVSAGLHALPGVTDVIADARAGQVTVSSSGALDETRLRAAVTQAGFTLVRQA